MTEQHTTTHSLVDHGSRQHPDPALDAVERLLARAERSHDALTRSYRLLGWTRQVQVSALPPDTTSELAPEFEDGALTHDDDRIREAQARLRLLAWEAADLEQCVPEEMELPRRQFAIHLYDMVRYAESLGMTVDRLLYHVEHARGRLQEER